MIVIVHTYFENAITGAGKICQYILMGFSWLYTCVLYASKYNVHVCQRTMTDHVHCYTNIYNN